MTLRIRKPSPQKRRWWVIALIILAVVASRFMGEEPNKSGRSVPADAVHGHPRLVDGDSFRLNNDEVRLVGIDAPEGRQICQRDGRPWKCGEASRDHLARLIGRDSISCDSLERDQHGRLLAICKANGKELNEEMIKSGFAVTFGRRYRRQEAEARAAKRGLWASQFMQPREWRRQHMRH